jgi:hypothetical protein
MNTIPSFERAEQALAVSLTEEFQEPLFSCLRIRRVIYGFERAHEACADKTLESSFTDWIRWVKSHSKLFSQYRVSGCLTFQCAFQIQYIKT